MKWVTEIADDLDFLRQISHQTLQRHSSLPSFSLKGSNINSHGFQPVVKITPDLQPRKGLNKPKHTFSPIASSNFSPDCNTCGAAALIGVGRALRLPLPPNHA